MNKAEFWEPIKGNKVKCSLCAHKCVISEGYFGICGMRQNISGELVSYSYGKIIAAHVDPIEKKPLYHFMPGTKTYSIASLGCNFKCGFCQNWSISQSNKREGNIDGFEVAPKEIVQDAIYNGCKSISYTYTEPTIFMEYARDIALLAQKEKIANVFVSNGFMTKKSIDAAGSFLDAANIDLKTFDDKLYKKVCGGKLDPVLETIIGLRHKGVWVEITTLIVPGFNNNAEDIKSIANFIVSVDKNMPWHISKFYSNYKYDKVAPTSDDDMNMAHDIALECGVKNIYLGNM